MARCHTSPVQYHERAQTGASKFVAVFDMDLYRQLMVLKMQRLFTMGFRVKNKVASEVWSFATETVVLYSSWLVLTQHFASAAPGLMPIALSLLARHLDWSETGFTDKPRPYKRHEARQSRRTYPDLSTTKNDFKMDGAATLTAVRLLTQQTENAFASISNDVEERVTRKMRDLLDEKLEAVCKEHDITMLKTTMTELSKSVEHQAGNVDGLSQ